MPTEKAFEIAKWDFKNDSILAELPVSDFNLLTANKTEKVFKGGEIIYREGAYPAGIFIILLGRIKKYKLDREGREQIIQVMNTGDIMGYQAVLSEGRYPVSATALEESNIAFIAREDFLNALHRSEKLTSNLLKALSNEFNIFANCVTLFTKSSVRERLALRLLILHEKYKTGAQTGETVEINMSRDDLASLVGSARENVLRELTALKEAGIVETRGRKIMVKDISRLIMMTDNS